MSTPANRPSARNRRISPRRNAKTSVRVACRKGTLGLGRDIAVGFADLSETGIRLTVKVPLARGDEVEIILAAVAGGEFKTPGTVMWVADGPAPNVHAIGVRFDKRIPYATLLELSRLPEQK